MRWSGNVHKVYTGWIYLHECLLWMICVLLHQQHRSMYAVQWLQLPLFIYILIFLCSIWAANVHKQIMSLISFVQQESWLTLLIYSLYDYDYNPSSASSLFDLLLKFGFHQVSLTLLKLNSIKSKYLNISSIHQSVRCICFSFRGSCGCFMAAVGTEDGSKQWWSFSFKPGSHFNFMWQRQYFTVTFPGLFLIIWSSPPQM